MTMGEKILNMRKARGWSQEELAERVGVTRQAVSRWESNSAKPDADKIIGICDLFGVSADYLLRDLSFGTEPHTVHLPQTEQKHGLSGAQIVGVILLPLNVVLWTVFGIVGSINGGTHYITYLDGRTKVYQGFMAFVTTNNLQWLLWLFSIMGILGLVLLVWDPLAVKIKEMKEQNKGS